MELNNKYLKVEFSSGENKGTAYYFFDHQGVFFKTITWKNAQGIDEPLDLEKKFTIKWLERHKSAIKGAYVRSYFEDSPMKIKINHNGFIVDDLVLNTILNSNANDDCLEGVYKFNKNSSNNKKIILEDYDEIGVIDLMEFEEFRNLFYLYNHKRISKATDYNAWLINEYNGLVEFKDEAIKRILKECGFDQNS